MVSSNSLLSHAGDIGLDRTLRLSGLHHLGGFDRVLHGAGAAPDTAGEFAHQAFEHLEFGNDLLALLLVLGLELFGKIVHPVARDVERLIQFHGDAAKRGNLALRGALVFQPREAGRHLLGGEKRHHAGEDGHRPAGEQRKRRP